MGKPTGTKGLEKCCFARVYSKAKLFLSRKRSKRG
jgi:hypothetical protein